MEIGAHVSTSGGLSKSIDRANEIGAEAIQIFASSPRSWNIKHPSIDEIILFKKKKEQSDINTCFIHGSYLVNICGDPNQLDKSMESLKTTMQIAAQIGSNGVIFHCGSHKGKGFDSILRQAANCITEVLNDSPPNINLCLENSAGMGSHVGSSFKELGALVKAVEHPNLKICLDTEHCYAAGYDISNEYGMKTTMDMFEEHIGLHKLVVLHANDSKVTLGAGIDRHENIGEGHIGISGFNAIMSSNSIKSLPLLLEVPGFHGNGPDKKNIDILKTIRNANKL